MASFVSAAGQVFSGDAEAKADSFNSTAQAQQASESLQQSYLRAGQMQRQSSVEQGRMRAAYGASGVTTSGTPLSVMLDQATRGEMNRQLGLYQGRIDALGHQQQSDVDHAQATAARWGGMFKAAGTLLTQGADVASANGATVPSWMG